MKPRLHARLRRAADAQRRLLRRAPVDGRLLSNRAGSRARRRGSTARPARPACRATRPARRTTSGPTTRPIRACCCSSAFIGNLVPGTGSQINGMVADGYPGMRPGEYFDFTPLVAAPRVGFAWDINGDGKQALRASTGIFYAIPTRGAVGELHRRAAGGVHPRRSSGRRSTTSRTSRPRARRSSRPRSTSHVRRRRDAVAREVLQPERDLPARHRLQHHGRSGLRRLLDLRGRPDGRHQPAGEQPVPAGGSEPDVQRQRAVDTNLLRTNYPGMGSINKWIDARDGNTVNNNTLRYNAMQVSVQRRLNRGLQMGLAYTLARGEGWTGYNQDILAADPTGALNRLRFWGPTGNNRHAQPDRQLQLHDPERAAGHAGASSGSCATGRSRASRSS